MYLIWRVSTIYGLPNIGVVGHVECPVTSATSQKMVTVLGATILIVQKRGKKSKEGKEGEV